MVPSRDPRQLPGERRLQAARGRRRIGKSPVEPDRGCHVRLVRFRLTVDGCSERPRLRLDHRWLSVVLVPRRSVGLAALARRGTRSGRSASRSSGDVPWPACSRPPAVLRAASSASARALTRQEPPTGRMPGRPVVPRARPQARRRSAALQLPAPEWPWPARPGWPDPQQWSYRSSSRPTVPAPDLDRGAATRCCPRRPAPRRRRSVANARLAAILLGPTRTLRLRSRVAFSSWLRSRRTTALRSDSAAVRKSRWKRPFPTRGVRCGIAFAPFISSAEAAHRRGSFWTSATATESRRVSASGDRATHSMRGTASRIPKPRDERRSPTGR